MYLPKVATKGVLAVAVCGGSCTYYNCLRKECAMQLQILAHKQAAHASFYSHVLDCEGGRKRSADRSAERSAEKSAERSAEVSSALLRHFFGD